jgi:DNA-binding transcriptional MerR regulator
VKPKILIGEMAKLHNISAQTLRYYDNIGLLKPAYTDEQNNYRYYGIEQFAHLDSILFLKRLGVPLKDVQRYFSERKLDSMIEMLKYKKLMINNEIELLRRRYKSIEKKVKLLEEYKEDAAFHQCKIKNTHQRRIVYLDFEAGGNEVHFEYGIKELSTLLKDDLGLFNGTISCIISEKQLRNKTYNYFKAVAILFDEDDVSSNTLSIFPAGNYAAIAYRGRYESGEEYYKTLISWIKKNNYQIIGDGIVLVIVDSAFTEYEKDYITEIQIPIKSC